MVYKAALDGSHCTGKSSIAKAVVGILGSIGVEAERLEEMSTEAKERGLPINEGTTLAAQRYILHRQFAEELRYTEPRETGPNYQVLVCDRGPGNYCYLKRNVGHDQETLDMVLDHADKFPYKRIYLLPIVNREIKAGAGTRATDKEFQLDMETETREFLKENFNDQLIELPYPTEEDPHRTAWVEAIVNQTMKDLDRPERIELRLRWHS